MSVEVVTNPCLMLVALAELTDISSSDASEYDPVTVDVSNEASAESVATMSPLCCMALVVAYVLFIGA